LPLAIVVAVADMAVLVAAQVAPAGFEVQVAVALTAPAGTVEQEAKAGGALTCRDQDPLPVPAVNWTMEFAEPPTVGFVSGLLAVNPIVDGVTDWFSMTANGCMWMVAGEALYARCGEETASNAAVRSEMSIGISTSSISVCNGCSRAEQLTCRVVQPA
jgi:hypothetical protein